MFKCVIFEKDNYDLNNFQLSNNPLKNAQFEIVELLNEPNQRKNSEIEDTVDNNTCSGVISNDNTVLSENKNEHLISENRSGSLMNVMLNNLEVNNFSNNEFLKISFFLILLKKNF